MTSYRKERMSEMVLAFLGEQIRRLSDPRLTLVTLTGVEMSPDLKHAKVYWTAPATVSSSDGDKPEGSDNFLSEAESRAVTEALNKASGLMKRRIGEELKLRYTPNLHFHYDESIARGSRIDQLLAKATGSH